MSAPPPEKYGDGKSTLLKVMVNRLDADEGAVEWGYETHPGYFAQDPGDHLGSPRRTAEEWISDFCEGNGTGFARGKMGMVLFSGDDADKRLGALSGGESARLVLCSLMIRSPNVLVLDEPTNHLDLESIDALVKGLKAFPGTLVFVSHDRWFVGRLADRIVEITEEGVRDYRGTYEEYVHFRGDDHLDTDTVLQKARKEKRRSRGGGTATRGRRASARKSWKVQQLEARGERLADRVETEEARVSEIDAVFAEPSFYESASQDDVHALQAERRELMEKIARLMREWEKVEARIAAAR